MRECEIGVLLALIAGSIGAGGSLAPAGAATLYAVSGDGAFPSETLYTLDTSNAAATSVLALGNGDDGEGIAYNPNDGLIYHTSGVSDGSEYLETLDPVSLVLGPNTVTADTYGPDPAGEVTALAWYEPFGLFLASDLASNLYHVTTGGSFTNVGSTGHMRGFAIVGSDVYGVDRSAGLLYKIDPNDGSILSTTALTVDGLAGVGGTGLATDPDTGEVYALLKNPLGGGGRLLATLDIDTGVATSIGNTGLSLSGITFVPEPSTALLLVWGLALLGLRRHRSR